MKIKETKLKEDKKKLQPSTVAKLKVVRQNDMGVFLDGQTGNSSDDILLHKLQQTEEVKIGDMVEVFLYKDPQKRLTASMKVPKMKEGQIARVKVINTSEDGAFLDVGAERGIFLPYAETRGKLQIGEVVWAKLYTDKSGRLAMSMKVEDALRRASKPCKVGKVGDMVIGSVYNITDKGVFLFTNERYIAFINKNELINMPKVGETISGRITFIRDDGRINISTRQVKEKALLNDAQVILDILHNRDGKMPYSDSSSPEVIKERFNLSKAAFKRAIGHLLKEKKIYQEDGWTYLK